MFFNYKLGRFYYDGSSGYIFVTYFWFLIMRLTTRKYSYHEAVSIINLIEGEENAKIKQTTNLKECP